MLFLAHVMNGVAVVADSLIWIVTILIIARAVISWVDPDPSNPIVRFLSQSTDPILRPISERIPLRAGAVDFTPILVLFGLMFLQAVLVGYLKDTANSIRIEQVLGNNRG